MCRSHATANLRCSSHGTITFQPDRRCYGHWRAAHQRPDWCPCNGSLGLWQNPSQIWSGRALPHCKTWRLLSTGCEALRLCPPCPQIQDKIQFDSYHLPHPPPPPPSSLLLPMSIDSCGVVELNVWGWHADSWVLLLPKITFGLQNSCIYLDGKNVSWWKMFWQVEGSQAEVAATVLWNSGDGLSIECDKTGMYRYAAKMDNEGALMYDAAKALKEAMIELGLACDGGKDSLSMAATAGSEVCHLIRIKTLKLLALLNNFQIRDQRHFVQSLRGELGKGQLQIISHSMHSSSQSRRT